MLIANAAFSQAFQEGFQFMAKGKPSQVTLNSGEVLDGNIKDIDWKRGVYEAILFTDNSGKDHDLKAADIKKIYGFPGGLEKLAAQRDFATNVKKMTDKEYSIDLLGKGMILFESTDVLMGKKQFNLLMQLLNPTFCSDIKVYRDPAEKETTRWGVAGVTLAGGDITTYYVKKGSEAAILVTKKSYKDYFQKLFGDSEVMMQRYGEKPIWYDFAKHIAEYSDLKK